MHCFYSFFEGRSGLFSSLACVLRATTREKVANFLRKKVHPGENPGYAYEFAHAPLEKKSCGRP